MKELTISALPKHLSNAIALLEMMVSLGGDMLSLSPLLRTCKI